MTTVEVLNPGMLSSVQDLGRVGYRHSGVPLSGAFDSVALRIGNRLLGNSENDAAIEMTIVGAEVRFTAPSVVCLTGGAAEDACIMYADRQIALTHQHPTALPNGSIVRVGRLSAGARCYLCVAGGIRCHSLLGSRSSLVSLPDAGLGAALCAGDQLPILPFESTEPVSSDVPSVRRSGTDAKNTRALRVVPGAHYDRFTVSQRESLTAAVFRVSDQSNRAGVRLSGNLLMEETRAVVPSEGTLPGYVQVPPSGEPIVLGVDGPTIGGYPAIACVIQADLPVLAQCALRENIRFKWVCREAAVRALKEQHAMVQAVQAHAPAPCSEGLPGA